VLVTTMFHGAKHWSSMHVANSQNWSSVFVQISEYTLTELKITLQAYEQLSIFHIVV
jgi:hypothetical protein